MLKLYNSLSSKLEAFQPSNPPEVKMYTCGPTVYDYAHIGNFRAYTLGDFVYRALEFKDYKVRYIMNLTDVGHLSDDGDEGDDKVEEAADREGKSAREITDFYIKHFISDYEKLNLKEPKKFTRATDYIQEQIDLVKKLEQRGFTYETSDGLYFDTSKFDEYGQLSGLKKEEVLEGARVEPNPEKKNPTDFALWKLSPDEEKRWQEWDSPWGTGFPGWHVECSAMSMSELGETIDIHIGGEDLKMVHHPNEIAQSECATGQKFVNYWLHNAFLQVDGGKMSKSLGNIYTVSDIESKGFDPIALRYFYMTAHYRSSINFTWNAIQSSENALKKLYSAMEGYKSVDGAIIDEDHLGEFNEALDDDLNMPKALSVVWDLVKDDSINEGVKLVTLLKLDEVLGFNLDRHVGYEIPKEVMELAKTREQYRKNNIWDKADMMRREIEKRGYKVEDTRDGFVIKKKL